MKQMTPSRFLDELPQDELEWLGRKKTGAMSIPNYKRSIIWKILRALIKR